MSSDEKEQLVKEAEQRHTVLLEKGWTRQDFVNALRDLLLSKKKDFYKVKE